MIQSNSSKRLPTFSSSDASGKAYEYLPVRAPLRLSLVIICVFADAVAALCVRAGPLSLWLP
jgi:hypothetical protein